MEFDEVNKVIISSMTRDEAKVFVLFLASEIMRHKEDIMQAAILIKKVAKKFKLDADEICEEVMNE